MEIGQATDRDTASLAEQAYRLELGQDAIRITANASPGLFYGVQTLVQLVKPERGKLWLPEGHLHWSTQPELPRPLQLRCQA